MNIHSKLPQRLIYFLSIAVLMVLPGLFPAQAKDTDIYLLAPSSTTDDKPNVLIILDNSGSMSETITSAQIAYDPDVDYCDSTEVNAVLAGAASGIPSDCADLSGRIYWEFPDNSGVVEPPSISSDQWFSSSKNKCYESISGGLSTAGKYAGDKVARWDDSSSRSSRNGWKTLDGKRNSNITYVDCEADGATDGLTAGDNQFPRDSTSSAYTGTSSSAFNWSGFNNDEYPTLFSANYMAYWHNSALVTSQSRMEIAHAAVNSLIDAYVNVRFGLMAFNDASDGGRVLFRVANMDSTRRTAMKSVVNSLGPETMTPLAETLWEAYRYLGGLGVSYGNPSSETPHQDSCAQNTTNTACDNGGYYDAIGAGDSTYNDGTYITPYTYGCQKSFIIYVTDGDPTNDSAANSNIATLTGTSCDGTSCLDDLASYMYNNDISSLPDAQIVRTYTIALGTGISSAGQTLLSDTATEGGGEYLTAVDGDELTTALAQVVNNILEVDTSFAAPSLSVNAFNRLYNRDDVYFALFNPSSSKAWDGNLKKFKLCNGTETSPACTFGAIIDANGVAAIDTAIDPATGKAPNKIFDTAQSYWSSAADGSDVNAGGAGAEITADAAVPRNLYTYRGSYSGLSSSSAATPVAIEAVSSNTVYEAAIDDPTILGLTDTSGSASDTNTTDTTAVTTLINWMRGEDAYDDDADCATGAASTHSCYTESRPWNFADPLHSRPVAFTFGCEGGSTCTSSSTPIIKLFLSTNDGMVRIINNSTGAEEWAFIPKEMLDDQYEISNNDPGDHIYGLDDSPAFHTVDLDNDGVIEPSAGDKVYMYVGMRRGGKNIYAFDVTPTAVLDDQTDTLTPKLMWVIEGGTGDFAQMGQSWSRPRVARIRAYCNPVSECDDGDSRTDDSKSRAVLIFGGGYDTNQDDNDAPLTDNEGNAIYIVDPFTGERIWWASNDSTASLVLDKMEFSIPSEVAAIDTNGDKLVDRLYVGDTGGQLWRIDLGSTVGDSGDGDSYGFVYADVGCDSTGSTQRVHDAAGACPAGTTDQGRRKFFYPPDVAMVKDSTYSNDAYYDLVTIGSGDREDPLDLLTSSPTAAEPVLNRIYAFRDYNYQTGAPASMLAVTPSTPSPLSEYDLYDATVDTIGSLTQTEINTQVKTSDGWYISLVEPSAVTLLNGLDSTSGGEKVLAKTIVFDGVLYVTTFLPANQDSVSAACTPNEGEARVYALDYLTGDAVYNQDSDASLDRFAVIGGGIPSEVVIVIRDGGVTGLVGTSGGAAGITVGGSLPRYKTYWYDE